MPARGALTLFHIRGIRIGVDYSWFVVLFLVILWLSGYYKSVIGSEDSAAAYGLALASAIAFFGSVLLHELGHAMVAIRNGIGISDITLWMFGGVARMTKDSDSPGTEFKIAIAGPLVTLAIAVACIAVGIVAAGSHDFWQAMRLENGADTSGILAVVAWLGVATVALAYVLFGRGLLGVGVATAGTLTLAEPATAAVLGIVVVGERFGGTTLIGVALIVAGLVSPSGRR